MVLFFEKGKSTKRIWWYQLNLNRNLGKTNPLKEDDLAEFLELQKKEKDSANSWTIDISKIIEETDDLSVKTPIKRMKLFCIYVDKGQKMMRRWVVIVLVIIILFVFGG